MTETETEMKPWAGPFHILSIDGGGVRGIFSAAVLAKLEQDLSVDITNHFDLIVGTSTGGIIALGLGLGLRPSAMVDFYLSHGPEIFPQSGGWAKRAAHGVRCLHRRKYDSAPLEAALRDVFGERKLGDSRKRLVIPSYNLGRDEVRLFKTAHHPRLRRDWKLRAWEVGMATSAAPTYFPAWRGIEDMRLIDGGVWANNPTMVGVIEAKSLLDVPLAQVRVLSLGTCADLACRPDELDTGGLLTWCSGAIDVLMRGQSVGNDNLAALLVGRERVRRIDPKVPPKVFRLDRTNTSDKLIAEAAHASLHFGPTFAEEFAAHTASKFVPHQPAIGEIT